MTGSQDNMGWARFDHRVMRPVDGLADPHLHAHVYVFNLIWDGERCKAGQFGNLKADGLYCGRQSLKTGWRSSCRGQDMGSGGRPRAGKCPASTMRA
jgi:hypothetical protein